MTRYLLSMMNSLVQCVFYRSKWLAFGSALLLTACTTLPDQQRVSMPQTSVSDAEWVAESQDSAEFMYELLVGEVAGQMGELALAAEYYLRAARRSDDPDIAERATRIALFSGDLDLALPAAEVWMERVPEHLEARQIYAALLISAGDSEQAAEQLDQLFQQLEISGGDGLSLLVSLVARSENTEAATAALSQLVDNYPENLELQQAYGRLLLQQGDYEAAHAVFAVIVEARPDDGHVLYTLALIHIEMQQYDEAGSLLQRVLGTGERLEESHYYLGRIAELEGDVAAAIGHYRRVQANNHERDAVFRLARLLGGEGQLSEARQALSRYRQRTREPVVQIQTYVLESALLRDAQEYSAGLELLNAALGEHRGDFELLYARALMAERLGDIDTLEEDLRFILRQDPNNVTALNALGYTLADRTDRHQEAYAYITRAFAQRPDDAAITDSMGWVLYRLGRLDEAEDLLRRAHAMMDDGEIASNLAKVLFAQGKRSEARQVLETALEKYPEHERLLRFQQQMGF
ncbi:Tetratricopeptide repeat-containing protein [Ectothiorhodosinus mongolicus]|uniref:Tetratricopeptide repeat-containing protein n=1 Tax=Ectothiorhodosinus mongolicus TaxID=233100 RepID=A0A1R3W189_9GAMM|nr:tetratricopeptide repeat protein [Ectothiorhodosinus mongolicus]SIT71134.1 Tetratricopeptide repeat-containing protein [Ectothiorhodosinus mongolicus]